MIRIIVSNVASRCSLCEKQCFSLFFAQRSSGVEWCDDGALTAPPEILDKDRRLEGAEQHGAGDEGDAVGDVAAGPPDEAVGRQGEEQQAERGEREAEEAHGLARL